MNETEMMEKIRKNIEVLRERIKAAAAGAGRSGGEITLTVVSKFRSPEEIIAVLDAGVLDIGENRVQEADRKRPVLPEGFRFRMIGHLQRNKAAAAVRIFDAIDSIDSTRLARMVSEESKKAGKVMPVLVQFNSSGEETKHGFEFGELESALEEIEKLEGIEVGGLMTIGPLTDDESEIRDAFRRTKQLYDTVRRGRKGFDVLSMGMTDDFEAAIEEGSNMVRIGRFVFEGR